jgi:4-azaleucine resistance transporter AzlC
MPSHSNDAASRRRLSMLYAGIRAESPILLGVFPFGLIYGALAREAGLTPLPAQMMSSIVFAGSSQFVAAKLIKDAAPGLVIVATIAVVNLRHVLYSASVAEYIRDLPLKWKIILAYLLTDEAYAATIVHYETEGAGPESHWFFLGAGFALWFTWQASSALGIFAGAAIPASWRLDFALPLTFIAMVTPVLTDAPVVAAALSAGGTALLAYGLPYKLGLILAAFVGILVGTLLERRR